MYETNKNRKSEQAERQSRHKHQAFYHDNQANGPRKCEPTQCRRIGAAMLSTNGDWYRSQNLVELIRFWNCCYCIHQNVMKAGELKLKFRTTNDSKVMRNLIIEGSKVESTNIQLASITLSFLYFFHHGAQLSSLEQGQEGTS